MFQRRSTPGEFSVVFFVSAVSGAFSLYFLNRVPDVHPHQLKMSGTPVPWRQIVSYPPFVRLVGFNLLYLFAFGSIPVFTVAFLKARGSFGENLILIISAAGFLAGGLALPALGELLDRIGSKRLFRWGMLGLGLCLASWSAIAGRLLPASFGLVLATSALGGLSGAATNLANARLQMNTMPAMGRSHFFAFFTVITSLCLGVTPIFWGFCIDLLERLHTTGGAVEWNRYSVYFTALIAAGFLNFLATAMLREDAGDAGG